MPQCNNTTVLEDGSVIPFVVRVGGKKGKARKGYHAADLLAAMTGADKANTWPSVEKPSVLIESLRIVGGDDLTARDQAAYEFLLANARAAGIDRGSHTVAIRDVMAYLNVDSVERVVEAIDRLARVMVRYDMSDDDQRRRGWLHLIDEAEIEERKSTGKATLKYSIPPGVRRVILESRSFRSLEVCAFARFRSRYTARLYQRLALRAGYTHKGFNYREPWVVDPRKLAEEIGYPIGDKWNYRHFERNCLKPAMEDIRLHVTRFHADFKRGKTGPGRGSPVAEIKFFVTPETPPLAEAPKRRIGPSEADYIVLPDPEHLPRELPSADGIRRAAGYLKRPALEVSDGYRAALAIAKRDRSAPVTPNRGEVLGMAGGWFLAKLRDKGPDAALEAWVHDLRVGKEIVLARPPINTAPAAPTPAPASAAPKPPAVLKGGLGAAPGAPEKATNPDPVPAAPSPTAADHSLWSYMGKYTARPQRRHVVGDLTEESMGIDRYAVQAAFGDFDDRDASDFEDEPEEAQAPKARFFDEVVEEGFHPLHPAETEEYLLPVDED